MRLVFVFFSKLKFSQTVHSFLCLAFASSPHFRLVMRGLEGSGQGGKIELLVNKTENLHHQTSVIDATARKFCSNKFTAKPLYANILVHKMIKSQDHESYSRAYIVFHALPLSPTHGYCIMANFGLCDSCLTDMLLPHPEPALG
ncbi:hypothetical protein VNO78_09931 [Psophocarpus tetragonolobus]|uniref:Uncharacterized protein n=1 Tax=Psophocarpus tetragonolobus TaxID=3891 RepID=A0AAN9SIW7_PSOTE